jgi:hypothetical protein
MTHVHCPGNPPLPPARSVARASAPHKGPPLASLSALAALAVGACAPTRAAPPPLPHTPFSHYQAGAEADWPASAGADGYIELFGFREGELLPPSADPWPAGRSLRGGVFNPHRRAERGLAPRREPAPP